MDMNSMNDFRSERKRRLVRRRPSRRRIAWEQLIGPLVGALLSSLPAWVGHVRWG